MYITAENGNFLPLCLISCFSPLTLYHVEIHRVLERQEGKADSLRLGIQRKKSRVVILASICIVWPLYLPTLYLNHKLTCSFSGPTWLIRSLELYFIAQWMDSEIYQNATNYWSVAMKPWKTKQSRRTSSLSN